MAVIGPLASSDLPRTPARTMAVCAENSDSDVLVMQTVDHGMGHDASDPLNWAGAGSRAIGQGGQRSIESCAISSDR